MARWRLKVKPNVPAKSPRRLSDRGFETAQLAHAVRAARLLDDATMKFEDFGKRQVPHQLRRR